VCVSASVIVRRKRLSNCFDQDDAKKRPGILKKPSHGRSKTLQLCDQEPLKVS